LCLVGYRRFKRFRPFGVGEKEFTLALAFEADQFVIICYDVSLSVASETNHDGLPKMGRFSADKHLSFRTQTAGWVLGVRLTTSLFVLFPQLSTDKAKFNELFFSFPKVPL
jgi:hypothetical protein